MSDSFADSIFKRRGNLSEWIEINLKSKPDGCYRISFLYQNTTLDKRSVYQD